MPTQESSKEINPKWLYPVLLMLCCGYFGKYFCTSDMYTVLNKFEVTEKISGPQMAGLFSAGYVASCVGKVVAGQASDRFGGKRTLMVTATGFIISTYVMSYMEGYPSFFVIWVINGFFALGMAWVCVVAVATNWIPLSRMGRLMGIVSMAPQLGDVLARLVLSLFMESSWRTVFRIAATIAIGLNLPILVFVKDRPEEHEETNTTTRTPEEKKPFSERLITLLTTPVLWIVCTLSGTLYSIRTLFLLYSVAYLQLRYCVGSPVLDECLNSDESAAAAAQASALYTILGCFSVVIVGELKDRAPKRYRGAVLLLFIVPLMLCLGLFWLFSQHMAYGLSAVMVGAIGFFLFGPYKLLGGALAVDIGGKHLKATACSLMGVFDNSFAVLVLTLKGYVGRDWDLMFFMLFCFSFLALFSATFVLIWDLRNVPLRRALSMAKPPSMAKIVQPTAPTLPTVKPVDADSSDEESDEEYPALVKKDTSSALQRRASLKHFTHIQ